MPVNNPFVTHQHSGPRRSLVLAGGGVRLAYQAGVIQAMQQAGLQFNHVDGTSGGIFNTGMLASGLPPDEMANRWRSLKLRYFMSALPMKSYLNPLRLSGMGDADGIRKGVFPSLGIDIQKIRGNRDFQATFNVCNFSEKTVESIPGNLVTEDLLVAGVSLPIFMPAIFIQNSWYTDAVWIKDANLMEAARQGAEEIWLVWAIGNSRKYLNGSFNQYVHMIEMSANGGLLEEFKQLESLNDGILKGESKCGQTSPIRLHVIKPQFPLPLDPDLFLNKVDTHTLINLGYSDAMNYLLNPESGYLSFGNDYPGKRPPVEKTNPDYRSDTGSNGDLYPGYSPKGLPLNTLATQMNEPGSALNFRMCFKGKINLNGVKIPVQLRIAVKLRNFKSKDSLHAVSSVLLENKEISTFHNTVTVNKTGDKTILLLTGFFREGSYYHFQCSIPVNSYVDWRLGLEFRTAVMEVFELTGGTEKQAGKGKLLQDAGDRIRYLLHSSYHDEDGSSPARKKHKMMRWFFSERITMHSDQNKHL